MGLNVKSKTNKATNCCKTARLELLRLQNGLKPEVANNDFFKYSLQYAAPDAP